MGNQISNVLPENENRFIEEEELLIREITKTSIDLADKYQQKFLEPDFFVSKQSKYLTLHNRMRLLPEQLLIQKKLHSLTVTSRILKIS